MNSPSEDIKDVLVTAGVGVFKAASGWSIHFGGEPAVPDTAITVYDSGGTDPNPKWLIDEPTVQVRVRAAKVSATGAYKAAFAKAQEVKDALLGFQPTTVNGTPYRGIWMNGDIFPLGQDDNNRFLFTLNFRIIREPASGTHRTAA